MPYIAWFQTVTRAVQLRVVPRFAVYDRTDMDKNEIIGGLSDDAEYNDPYH